jgi:Tol biopolymer transport system component
MKPTREFRCSIIFILSIALFCGPQAGADYVFETPEIIPPTAAPFGGTYPCISADGLTMYLDVPGEFWNPPSVYDNDIGMISRESLEGPWSEPVSLGRPVNTSGYETAAWISADGLTLYFSSNRSGGYGSYDIYASSRTSTQESWGNPVNLGLTVNSNREDFSQCISADGLSLYFVSMRAGGYGGTDIWLTTRETTDSPWSEAVNLGPAINDEFHNSSPSISADGMTLIFASHFGWDDDNDLFMARWSTADVAWQTPVSLGEPINTDTPELYPCLSLDGRTLYFSRYNAQEIPEIFASQIEPVVDFNADDAVNLDDLVILIENWGSDNTLCDIGPTPLGDGIVDVADLEVFMEHWEK